MSRIKANSLSDIESIDSEDETSKQSSDKSDEYKASRQFSSTPFAKDK